jgi:polyprenyldihydroxybenzoate methyltransferase/3-demethylubiquinol 3-O-methyltransferase
MAYLATIVAAERVLGVVSPGTHTFAKYINPSELVDFFAAHRSAPDARPWISAVHAYNQSVLPSSAPSRHEAEVRGMLFQPWSGEWTLAPRSASYGLASWLSQQMNYIFWVRKPADAE